MQGMIKAVKGKKEFRLEMIGEVLCYQALVLLQKSVLIRNKQ